MKPGYQNGFFLFGIAVLAVMLTQLDYAEVWKGLREAGYWSVAVIVLWAFLYLFNTSAWWLIINAQERTTPAAEDAALPRKGHTEKVGFLWLYKVTVSGFALNYATPGGLMGGEPYRILSLSPKIGTERASSSVILYVMTHIFSHFWFWLLAVALYVCVRPLDVLTGFLLTGTTVFCLLGLWFFIVGYRKGLAFRAMNVLRHIPYIKKKARSFIERHQQQLHTIDQQIAALHQQAPKTFVTAVLLELGCRICSALEIYFILRVLMPHVNYLDCILILAFTTLFANMLFFMPLQLGGREGGFLMSTAGLGLTASAGIFVALIVRLRELVWTGIGLLLIKVDRKQAGDKGSNPPDNSPAP